MINLLVRLLLSDKIQSVGPEVYSACDCIALTSLYSDDQPLELETRNTERGCIFFF